VIPLKSRLELSRVWFTGGDDFFLHVFCGAVLFRSLFLRLGVFGQTLAGAPGVTLRARKFIIVHADDLGHHGLDAADIKACRVERLNYSCEPDVPAHGFLSGDGGRLCNPTPDADLVTPHMTSDVSIYPLGRPSAPADKVRFLVYERMDIFIMNYWAGTRPAARENDRFCG